MPVHIKRYQIVHVCDGCDNFLTTEGDQIMHLRGALDAAIVAGWIKTIDPDTRQIKYHCDECERVNYE